MILSGTLGEVSLEIRPLLLRVLPEYIDFERTVRSCVWIMAVFPIIIHYNLNFKETGTVRGFVTNEGAILLTVSDVSKHNSSLSHSCWAQSQWQLPEQRGRAVHRKREGGREGDHFIFGLHLHVFIGRLWLMDEISEGWWMLPGPHCPLEAVTYVGANCQTFLFLHHQSLTHLSVGMGNWRNDFKLVWLQQHFFW